MKRVLLSLGLGLCLPLLAMAQDSTKASMPMASTHVLTTPAQLKWGDAPAGLPKGARLAVLSGDPGAPGTFTVRLKFPAGYKIAPHTHPTDEHVTVISGVCLLGMGDKFDRTAMKTLPVGGYALLPAEMSHFASTRTGATVQIQGNGPFAINYVNPMDDPRNATGSGK